MYISVWRTVYRIVMLANLELDIFLDRKPVTIDYRHTFSFIYTSNVGKWVGRKLLQIPGPD
jgi:hypothetical protein